MSTSDIVLAIFSTIFAIPLLVWATADFILKYYCFRETKSLWVLLNPFEAITWATREASDEPALAFWIKVYKFGLLAFIPFLLLLPVFILLSE
jgi:hypothetical protein